MNGIIQLPAGFDVNMLMSDFFSIAAPIVGVAFIFLAYKVIRKAISL